MVGNGIHYKSYLDFAMLYDTERGGIKLALCGDIIPSRRLAVHRDGQYSPIRSWGKSF